MKKAILILSIFFSFAASAQIDSTQMKVSLTLQARDWLYISDGIKHLDQFERLYDSLKARVYVLTNPQSTVSAKVDSISVGNLIEISRAIRTRQYGYSVFVFDRINTAIRAVSNTYLQSQLDIMDAYFINYYGDLLSNELQRLKKVRQ